MIRYGSAVIRWPSCQIQWVSMAVMSIVALALTGAVDGHTVWGFAALVPAAVAGYLLSRRINRFLDPKRLRWLAIGASTLGAVVLIGRELLPI